MFWLFNIELFRSIIEAVSFISSLVITFNFVFQDKLMHLLPFSSKSYPISVTPDTGIRPANFKNAAAAPTEPYCNYCCFTWVKWLLCENHAEVKCRHVSLELTRGLGDKKRDDEAVATLLLWPCPPWRGTMKYPVVMERDLSWAVSSWVEPCCVVEKWHNSPYFLNL